MPVPEFIDRINNPKNYPVIYNKDGTVSTHRMAAEVDKNTGQWYAFPTIVQFPDGTLYEFKDNMQAKKYNLRTGNYLRFGNSMESKKKALEYADGGYKKGTALENFFVPGNK